MGYSPWGCIESDTTWQLNNNNKMKSFKVYGLSLEVGETTSPRRCPA